VQAYTCFLSAELAPISTLMKKPLQVELKVSFAVAKIY